MSDTEIKPIRKKVIPYASILFCVVLVNVYSNKQYEISDLKINLNQEIQLLDSSVKPILEPKFYNKLVKVPSGYSIDSLLLSNGISEADVVGSSRALSSVFDPRDLKAGNSVVLTYDWNNRDEFLGYEIELNYDKAVVVLRDNNGFSAKEIDKDFNIDIVTGKGDVINTLYGSAVEKGVSPNIVMTLIQLYSFDIDFQRDIKSGTGFEVVYENYMTQEGDFIRNGSIIAAVMDLEDRRLPIYRFTTDDGRVDYYNADGKSARKSLLKTPVNGAYISSGFGMRVNPISGYTAIHRGMDFAVRQGTPIYASGDGVIVRAIHSNTGYGNHIMIRHPNGYETLYGHMVSHAKGMALGVRVTQGQVIGYVGSTGNSTGPHLHYETRYQGQFVNPSSIEIPPGRSLDGDELKRFIKFRDSIKLDL